MTLAELEASCAACHACPLGDTRTKLVFGVGCETADLMFVGEAPGEKEDLSGIPFVGAAGKLFDRYLEAVDIPRESVYIANILKCRPPKNRDPLPEEQEACSVWLNRQIELLNPAIIVCLGRIAAMRFIRSDFKISREHGVWFEKDGRRVMALYHPAALLRDPRKRPETFEDLKRIQKAAREL